MSVAEHLATVRGRIDAACRSAGRDPAEVTLVAVSKRQPDEKLLEAYATGQRDFGENYVQELERKRQLLPEDARWHQIGHVQSNKAKKAAAAADVVHTLDSEKLARALDKAAAAAGRRLGVLVEVNLAREDQKAGIAPDAVPKLLEACRSLGALSVKGLMCIPPAGEGERWFAALAALQSSLKGQGFQGLEVLSMGMSADFEAAIAYGATMVRVGTAVFGARDVT